MIHPNTQRRKTMASVNQFSRLVTLKEGKKKSMSIAQVGEVLKITRTLLKRAGVDIYRIIGTTPISTFK